MPKSRKDEMIAFDSPFDNKYLIQFGNLKSCTDAMDVMLNTFQDGMEKTNSGYGAMRTLFKNGPLLVNWTTPLKEAGLLGEDGGDPTVDQVVELGKHVKIVGPDGNVTDFSTAFFNNPTVESFREKEKGLTKRDKHYGNVLLGYMGLFLSGKKDERLKNIDSGFKGMNPSDAKGYQVFIELPDKTRQIVTDSATKQKRDEVIEKLESAEQVMKSFPEEPTIPARPVESNPFRRFFAWVGIVKHSKAYNDGMAKYEQAKKDRETYDAAKKTIEDTLNDSANDRILQNAAEQQHKVDSLFEAKSKDIGNIRVKLTQVNTLKKIVDSKAAVFTKGSVSAILDIIHNRPIAAEEVKKAQPSEEDAKAIENLRKYGQISDDVYVDDAPVEDINRFITLVSPAEAGVYAFRAEQAGPEYRNEEFNNATKDAYAEMVKDSKRSFEENFGIEASPANVQAVADAFELDKYVKYGVQKIDGKEYGKEDVLPKVDATNVGDMTLLLMSGIKTVAVQGHLLDKPRAAAQPKESDISHDIVPYRNENGPKEAGGPVNTL